MSTLEYITFLRKISGGRLRPLASIDPDSGKIAVASFDSLKAVKEWLSDRNGKVNLYFTVNRTKRQISRKPKKEDIGWFDFAHVELDPPAASTPAWRKKMRGVLKALPYPPTVIWDSGNGVQALWKMLKPVKLVDDETRAKCEAVNKGLLDAIREACAGDVETQGTFNVDRLLRLPGTWNLPNALKRAKGRNKEYAGNVEFN